MRRRNYSRDDVRTALKECGIGTGSTVYVSTSLGLIGRPPENVKSSEDLCHLFYEAIWDVIGEEGTLIVPTYSYTFGKGTPEKPPIFDPLSTPAEIGDFPNFVLRQEGVHRSFDPMLSVVCKGKRCAEFIDDLPNASYAEGSFLSRLAKSNTRLLNLGIGPIWLPFVHYIDWVMKAPYRFDKIFKGFIKKGDELVPVEWTYYARILKDNTRPKTEVVGRMAEKEGLWSSAPLGKINIYSIVCRDYFEFVKKQVKQNPWILVRGPEFVPEESNFK